MGANAYLAEILSVTISGSLGPSPNQLLTEMLARLRTALGRTLQHAPAHGALLPDQYREERDGMGEWSGVVTLRLVNFDEISHLSAMLHGASVDIGGAFSPITTYNPRVDSTTSGPRPGGRRGGRR
jgi:hypothetical protein